MVVPRFGPIYNRKAVSFGTSRTIAAVRTPYGTRGERSIHGLTAPTLVVGYGTCGHEWHGTGPDFMRGLFFYPQGCPLCVTMREP